MRAQKRKPVLKRGGYLRSANIFSSRVISLHHKRASKEYRYFLKRDFSRYSGKWVAIRGERVIASSDTIRNMLKEKPTASERHVALVKIPEKHKSFVL